MIRDAIGRYAARFHELLDGRHGVASPFGAWLLLALVAPAARGAARDRLVGMLGCPADEAYGAAIRMLDHPHAELVLGAAVWHDEQFAGEALLDFLRRLAGHVETGRIPTQAEADAWASARTLGLLERFPLELEAGDPVAVLLATAIATRVSWQVPFFLTGAGRLQLPAATGFAGQPVLEDSGASVWSGFTLAAGGLVAGYAVQSTDGLVVMSVLGAADMAPAAVLDAAQQLAIAVASGSAPAPTSLFDLEPGAGPGWLISEETTTYLGSPERYEFFLPAWTATSSHDLLAADLGFDAAGEAVIGLLPPPPPGADYYPEARQSALARYTRTGFEAAAVTALGARVTSAPQSREGPVRTARVEFTQPHAVVAATCGRGDWDGLPVFSCWVAEAVPAE